MSNATPEQISAFYERAMKRRNGLHRGEVLKTIGDLSSDLARWGRDQTPHGAIAREALDELEAAARAWPSAWKLDGPDVERWRVAISQASRMVKRACDPRRGEAAEVAAALRATIREDRRVHHVRKLNFITGAMRNG